MQASVPAFRGRARHPLASADAYRDGQRWGRSPRRAWLVLRVTQPPGRRACVFEGSAPTSWLLTSTSSASSRACEPTASTADRRRAARPTRSRASATCGSGRGLRRAQDPRGAPPARSRNDRLAGRAPHAPCGWSSPRAARAFLGRAGPRSTAWLWPALRRDDLGRAGRPWIFDEITAVRGCETKRIGHKGADLIAPDNGLASFDARGRPWSSSTRCRSIRPLGRLALAHDFEAAGSPDAPAAGALRSDVWGGGRIDVDLKTTGYELRVVDALRAQGGGARAHLHGWSRRACA